MMKKIFAALFLSLSILSAVCSCGKEKETLTIENGTYFIEGTDTTFTFGENNTLTVHGYDFTEMEESVYENPTIYMEKQKLNDGEELSDERIQMIRESIDLSGQFLDKAVKYETEDEEGTIGIYVPVENCEFFFYAQYFPNNKTIVFDDRILKREEK